MPECTVAANFARALLEFAVSKGVSRMALAERSGPSLRRHCRTATTAGGGSPYGLCVHRSTRVTESTNSSKRRSTGGAPRQP